MADETKVNPRKGKPSANKGVKKPVYLLFKGKLDDAGQPDVDILGITRKSEKALDAMAADPTVKYKRIMLDDKAVA